jgi:hypothetical protein
MGVNGLLDLIYQKILIISNQAVSSSVAGNITNLLYTDTQKIAMMFTYLPQILQAPMDLIVYIIYLGIQVDPIAMCGLMGFFVIFPLIGIVMANVVKVQKQIMNLKDLRVKRSSEVLNGMKVVKLFSLEKIQHARL